MGPRLRDRTASRAPPCATQRTYARTSHAPGNAARKTPAKAKTPVGSRLPRIKD